MKMGRDETDQASKTSLHRASMSPTNTSASVCAAAILKSSTHIRVYLCELIFELYIGIVFVYYVNVY